MNTPDTEWREVRDKVGYTLNIGENHTHIENRLTSEEMQSIKELARDIQAYGHEAETDVVNIAMLGVGEAEKIINGSTLKQPNFFNRTHQMREIKFRVWNWNDRKEPVFIEISRGEWLPEGLLPDSAVIEQYTGLKDKNGKEIYEGDIWKDENGNKKLVDDAILGEFVYIEHHECGRTAYGEVIGNIWEHPNLLESKRNY